MQTVSAGTGAAHHAHRSHHHQHHGARAEREGHGPGRIGGAHGHQAKSLVADLREAGVDLPRAARSVFAAALAQGAEAQSLFEAMTARAAEDTAANPPPAPAGDNAEPAPATRTESDAARPPQTAGPTPIADGGGFQASANVFRMTATQGTAAIVASDDGLAAYAIFSRTEVTIVQASVAISGFAEAAEAIAPEAAAEIEAEDDDDSAGSALPASTPWIPDLTGAETALQLLQDAAA